MADDDLSKLTIQKQQVKPSRRRGRGTTYLGLAAAALLLAGVLYWTGLLAPALPVQIGTVTQVYPSQAFTTLNASGYVVAQRKSALAAKVTGRLVWLGVREGDRVKKDQVVAKLENEDVTASQNQALQNVDVAVANLEQAQAELKDAALALSRNKELVSRNLIAQADYDSALARYKKADGAVNGAQATIRANKAALQGATVAVGYTLIRAPFDAVVLTKNADIGDIVTPIGAVATAKAAVVTIADMDSLEVEADVSESNLEKVKKDQPCEIQLDAFPNSRFGGYVHTMVPTADRTKATVLVKVSFNNKDPRVLPEMSAKVAFLSRPIAAGEERPFVAVNRSAIATKKGKKTVFVVSENRAVETTLETGPTLGEMTEIKSGVKPGAQVVLNPPDRLRNGSRVKILEK
jgi:RND family efflux transporter MFP subunit